MMKKTIDLSFEDMMEDTNAGFLYGRKPAEIKKMMNMIEDKCFQGRRVYHRSNEMKSPVLLRYEIKNLLLFLLKLYMDDFFDDKRTKPKGVSGPMLDKLLENYEKIETGDMLRNYEGAVLVTTSDSENSIKFLKTLSEFKKSLSRFTILFARHYHEFPTDLFTGYIKMIDDLSKGIAYASLERRTISNFGIPICGLDQSKMTVSMNVGELSLDLRNAVVSAINRMCDELYNYDDNRGYARVHTLSCQEKIKQRYHEVYSKHIDDKGVERSADDIDLNAVRKEIDKVMNEYWTEKCPLLSTSYYSHNSDEEIDEKVKKAKVVVYEYMIRYCKIRGFFYGLEAVEDNALLNKDLMWKEMVNLRTYAENFVLFGRKYEQHLRILENEVWKECQGGQKIIDKTKIEQYVTRSINAFRIYTDSLRVPTFEEFEAIDGNAFLDTEMDYVWDNIKEVRKLCGSLAENMLAMILKLEYHRNHESEDDEL